ncbi:hypothetical protein NDU88_002047 [Pleurodeles waltl]|uniref:Uncharacterized protein n=1 Tax=Pleurodeles waltl TaxID=8319 RepID=A0AAV7MM77_PLEWA|nr:hypothetical protein NDU88_002047 [Pleurodeles waltl]
MRSRHGSAEANHWESAPSPGGPGVFSAPAQFERSTTKSLTAYWLSDTWWRPSGGVFWVSRILGRTKRIGSDMQAARIKCDDIPQERHNLALTTC